MFAPFTLDEAAQTSLEFWSVKFDYILPDLIAVKVVGISFHLLHSDHECIRALR